jgi:hypothetical protein
MNRQELAWIIVRTLGVITLWLFAVTAFGFILFILTSAVTFTTMSKESIANLAVIPTTLKTASTMILELVFYGFLSSYLLRKGHFVHRLLLKNIPAA